MSFHIGFKTGFHLFSLLRTICNSERLSRSLARDVFGLPTSSNRLVMHLSFLSTSKDSPCNHPITSFRRQHHIVLTTIPAKMITYSISEKQNRLAEKLPEPELALREIRPPYSKRLSENLKRQLVLMLHVLKKNKCGVDCKLAILKITVDCRCTWTSTSIAPEKLEHM